MPPQLSLSLPHTWQLYYFPPGQRQIASPADLFSSGLQPIPAEVPGNVELDLQRAGLLPDPFFGDYIRRLRPLETNEWWYTVSFRPPEAFTGQRAELVFSGLDTLATVWINGQWVGNSANMLIAHRFEVTGALAAGQDNLLVVRLASALAAARQETYEPGMLSWEHRSEGLRLRKAPHVWGWDIMPRAVSAGIWQPVILQTIPEHAIDQLYFWTAEVSAQQALLGVWFQVRSTVPTDELTLRLSGSCASKPGRFNFNWPLEFISDHFTIPIAEPALWWPAGYGPPDLYTVTTQLCRGESVLDERTDQIGLRQVTLQRTENAAAPRAWQPASAEKLPFQSSSAAETPEAGFRFVVNHQPVMVKGANWVPLDAFHSRDAARLQPALEMVADLGCNMLRCWGGSVYPSDDFYAWCDAHGVMVWQDFAFACAIYPQEDHFLAEVEQEIQTVTQRLRNHPALVIWCGDNEIDMVYLSQGRDPQHNRLTRQAIPRLLQRFDPHRAYVPSSPYVTPGSAGAEAWSATAEQHLWGARDYFKGEFYTRHSAHFIGEIGYHGCNQPSSIQKFISAARLWPPTNDEWQVHSVYHWRTRAIERDRIELMAKQVRALFGAAPDDLPAFALASQIAQAEALKYFVESTRQRKWFTSGILWWNLLDGWPQFSDAVVDYYYAKKLAYHYLWRVQQPVLVFIADPFPQPGRAAPGFPVIIGNDSLQDADVAYHVRDADTGAILAQGEFTSPANQNWQTATIEPPLKPPRLFLIEWQTGAQRFGNHYLWAEPPLDLAQYVRWLPAIAALPRDFSTAFWAFERYT